MLIHLVRCFRCDRFASTLCNSTKKTCARVHVCLVVCCSTGRAQKTKRMPTTEILLMRMLHFPADKNTRPECSIDLALITAERVGININGYISETETSTRRLTTENCFECVIVCLPVASYYIFMGVMDQTKMIRSGDILHVNTLPATENRRCDESDRRNAVSHKQNMNMFAMWLFISKTALVVRSTTRLIRLVRYFKFILLE